MRIQLAAVAGLFASAQAFRDTSPFLLFSSSPLSELLQDASKTQLQSRAEVLKSTKAFLSSCPSDIYFILRQDSITSSELSSAPHLKDAVSKIDSRATYMVSDVVGWSRADGEQLMDYIVKTCGAKKVESWTLLEAVADLKENGRPVVVEDALRGLEGDREERKNMIGDNDATLYTNILNSLSKAKSYTIIYTTTPTIDTPAERPAVYEAAFNELLHLDLKRELHSFDKRAGPMTNDTRPLFEKYNFLSPGLFMGLMVSFLLLSILAVGINAVSSLQVSYGAFDKEMGPAAHKKQ